MSTYREKLRAARRQSWFKVDRDILQAIGDGEMTYKEIIEKSGYCQSVVHFHINEMLHADDRRVYIVRWESQRLRYFAVNDMADPQPDAPRPRVKTHAARAKRYRERNAGVVTAKRRLCEQGPLARAGMWSALIVPGKD